MAHPPIMPSFLPGLSRNGMQCTEVIRILAYRVDFFTKPGWRWNLFDFLLVFLQLSTGLKAEDALIT
ncbi:scn4aa [Symbiodinium pilosum]|uniref:Scn4aa protein n=1 Tax=Symbiodinium pilosum TaxID=2952 RepID=A0A812XJ66_SYMPI|nr:scn4aa [Symbiodinium pilosum]